GLLAGIFVDTNSATSCAVWNWVLRTLASGRGSSGSASLPTTGGAFFVPSPALPWHFAQCFAKSLPPSATCASSAKERLAQPTTARATAKHETARVERIFGIVSSWRWPWDYAGRDELQPVSGPIRLGAEHKGHDHASETDPADAFCCRASTLR